MWGSYQYFSATCATEASVILLLDAAGLKLRAALHRCPGRALAKVDSQSTSISASAQKSTTPAAVVGLEDVVGAARCGVSNPAVTSCRLPVCFVDMYRHVTERTKSSQKAHRGHETRSRSSNRRRTQEMTPRTDARLALGHYQVITSFDVRCAGCVTRFQNISTGTIKA